MLQGTVLNQSQNKNKPKSVASRWARGRRARGQKNKWQAEQGQGQKVGWEGRHGTSIGQCLQGGKDRQGVGKGVSKR